MLKIMMAAARANPVDTEGAEDAFAEDATVEDANNEETAAAAEFDASAIFYNPPCA